MRALRWHGRGRISLDEIPAPPAPARGEVIVRVVVAGFCGTDIGEFEHGPTMIHPSAHPLTGATPPITMGHEFSGVISAVGEGVDLEIGTRVTADPCLRCGKCRWCREGDYHICAKGGSIGLAADGAFAEYVTVPAENIVLLPDSVSFEWAALAEPLAVGLHAVTRAGVRPGDSVLILGGGPIGFAALLAARLAGAAAIYVSEPLEDRARMIRAIGATEVFDPREVDVRQEVFRRTGRVGPDAVIEATGRADQFELATTSVRRGGHVSLAGISPSKVSVDLRQIVFYERNIHGSLGYNFDLERVIALMAAGRLDPTPLITSVIELDEAVATLSGLAADRSTQIKVLISI